MAYTNEQIEKYKEILNTYTQKAGETLPPEDNRFRCWNCKCDDFYVESGFYMCHVIHLMDMLLDIMIIKNMIDFIIIERVYIRESTIMKIK